MGDLVKTFQNSVKHISALPDIFETQINPIPNMKKSLFLAVLISSVAILVADTIDLQNLFNYENQTIPAYIQKDNTGDNEITDEGATLGRVLFYDKHLSSNNTISCASCHKQEFAFGDTAVVSVGVNGVTGRHAMRLINSRFADEAKFFWDERADSLEMQSTMPIQDHNEMGYSGTQGDPDFNDLIIELEALPYYEDLFVAAFGDASITEDRIQKAISQFVRSIQSFDAKYDIGRALAPNDGAPFPNFTQQENLGKQLFIAAPQFNPQGERVGGGAGCGGCHRAPEFDIDPNSLNNGFIFAIGGGNDFTNTKAPSLRDVIKANGEANGPMMHTGGPATIQAAIAHYNNIVFTPNANIDPRLTPGGNGQSLNLTQQEIGQLAAFIATLAGTDVYTNEKWSDPFDQNGNITILGGSVTTSITETDEMEFSVYPNPTSDYLNLALAGGALKAVTIYDMGGRSVRELNLGQYGSSTVQVEVYGLAAGTYHFAALDNTDKLHSGRFVVTH